VGWGKRYLYPLLALLLLALLLPIQSGSEVYAQTDGWISKADTPEAGGYGEAVVGTDNYIYVARCLYASSTPCFWRYDPATNAWDSMSVSGLPTGAFRSGAALAWDYDHYIYSLLGARYEDDRYLFYRYDISSNSWEQLSNTPYEQGAGDAVAWSGYDGYIYAILGSNEHGAAFARYDISEDSWETLLLNPSWTVTDDGASLVWTGGEYLYALRGEWEETTPHGDFARYHIPTGTWQDMSPLPDPGGVGDGASLLWVGSWVDEYSDYVFALGGGTVGPDESPGYDFYRYSISDNSWQQLGSIPCPVGYYVGNRLGFANGHIYYWQGSPTTSRWICGGKAFYMFEAPVPGYYLTVVSDYGDPQGEGWYDSGSTATFSVTSPVGTIARHFFTGWGGDSTATTPTVNILMDEPKTVTANWRTDYTYLYALIGGIAGTTVAVLAIILWRRRGKALKLD
jgi:uncharacterized repeat protein (TIGR02543 family)